MVLLLLVSLIPISCNAFSTKKELRINNNIKVYGKVANFESGILGNEKLKELAGTDTSTSDNAYSVVDTNIKKVLRAQSLLVLKIIQYQLKNQEHLFMFGLIME